MKKSLLLLASAGMCFGGSAFGQLKPSSEGIGHRYQIDQDGHILAELGPYSGRAVGYTYSNYLFNGPALGATSNGAGHRHDLEDISYTPGPWQSAPAPFTVSKFAFSLRRVAAVGAPATAFLQYRWWNAADVNWNGFGGAGTSVFNPTAVPVQTLNITLPVVTNDLINGFELNLATPFTLPATATFVEARLLTNTTDPGTDLGVDAWRLVLSNASGAAVPGNPGTIGSTTPDFGLYQSATGPTGMIGGAANAAPPNRHRSGLAINFPPNAYVTMDFAMGGDIPAQQPPCQSFVMGADNAFASDTTAYTATGSKWYCVTLAHDATDENLRYLDLDTEGSAVDAAIAVYRNDGTLVASDDGAGSGTNAMLSFGIGRRDRVGDGRQYDGRNWDDTQAAVIHGLAAGTYYVVVAPSGVGSGAAFSAGYTAVGSGTAGNITLRMRGNDSATGTLATSVAPIATRIIGLSSEDPIVAWFDVNLCHAADAGNMVTFDTTGSTSEGFNITLFDGVGNMVNQMAGTPAAPAILSFGGGNPALAAGHYYAALTYAPLPDLAPSPTTNGRWHARGENGSLGFNFQLSVTVPWAACAPAGGCTADFNCDGDVGTDLDISSFFACLSGTCPAAPCANTADFNNDGDVGTDGDIESFFRVLGGGPC